MLVCFLCALGPGALQASVVIEAEEMVIIHTGAIPYL